MQQTNQHKPPKKNQLKNWKQWLGALCPVHILWLSFWRKSVYAGCDFLGNRYFYETKHGKRWVLYAGLPEASCVPPPWHGWLHYQTDEIPRSDSDVPRYAWQKSPVPNQTGTDQAFYPDGHILKGGVRKSTTGDYEPWTPPDNRRL